MLTKDLKWWSEEDGSHEGSQMGHDCDEGEGSTSDDDSSMGCRAVLRRRERPRTTAEADDDVSGNEATTRMATEERGLGSATEGGGRVERARGWLQVGPRADSLRLRCFSLRLRCAMAAGCRGSWWAQQLQLFI